MLKPTLRAELTKPRKDAKIAAEKAEKAAEKAEKVAEKAEQTLANGDKAAREAPRLLRLTSLQKDSEETRRIRKRENLGGSTKAT